MTGPSLLPTGSLVLLVGPPGAGKSTFAWELVEHDHVAPEDVLSTDTYRELITGSASDTARDRKVFSAVRAALRERMARGSTTVVDATNLWPARRARYMAVARAAGRPAVAIRFDVPVPELLARNAGRERQVPPGAVVAMARQARQGASADALAAEGFDLVLGAEEVLSRLHRVAG